MILFHELFRAVTIVKSPRRDLQSGWHWCNSILMCKENLKYHEKIGGNIVRSIS